jgi:TolB-like protein
MGSPEQSVQSPGEGSGARAVSEPAAQPVTPESQAADSIWDRIRRHKVVEWTLAYLAFGYALLHGIQMLRETFDWPFLVPRLTVFALALGAPIAVTLAWFHGHRARHRISGPELSILIALLVAAGSVLWWVSRSNHEHVAAPTPAEGTSAGTRPAIPSASFNPPPHSIAVLPFVNLSEDRQQEYFSEGLTEELLNSLAAIDELQVAARTSSFSFKEQPDVITVAHKLNVASVLEGSVRRSSSTVRVTAQLINAETGFHLWSKTYDRDLGDVLQLQTEIATAVANALKVTLLGGVSAKIELGGTHNPAAFDAYLRASKALSTSYDARGNDLLGVIATYTEAIRLDPGYALAIAGRSLAVGNYASEFAVGEDRRRLFAESRRDAQQAIALAPELAAGHFVLARYFENGALDFANASEEYERAFALAPGDTRVLRNYARFQRSMGRGDAGLSVARRSVILDPLDARSHAALGGQLLYARRFREAIAAFQDSLMLDPTNPTQTRFVGSPAISLATSRAPSPPVKSNATTG